MIEIGEVVLHRLEMPMRMRFQASYGEHQVRDLILVELRSADGVVGWGESVAMRSPTYSEETTDTVAAVLVRELVPLVLGRAFAHPADFLDAAAPLIGNRMAKAAVESALWDIFAQRQGLPLSDLLGGVRSKVEVGVSIGIQPIDSLLAEVERYVRQGYKRIKLKVQPGFDLEPIGAIRSAFPGVPLMVDANGAYDPGDDTAVLRLDELGLLMIEQPFARAALERSARVQAQMTTDLCLDESIATVEDAARAIRLGACRVITVKFGRLGGLQAAVELAEQAGSAGVKLWCGGMFETGIGRAHNIALSSRAEFTLPGDTAASSRYWVQDIIEPPVVVEDGCIPVPTAPGLGFTVDTEHIQRYQTVQRHYRRQTGGV